MRKILLFLMILIVVSMTCPPSIVPLSKLESRA